MVARGHRILHISILAFLLSACAGTGLIPERFRTPQPAPPRQSTPKPKASIPTVDPLTANPEQNVAEMQIANELPNAETSTAGVEVGRTDLLGGWKIAAGSDSCELFMSLTGWAGGYRATTKGCSSDVLANIQAWNLNDQEIMLIDSVGEPVARLFATTKLRFNGQTEDGIGITVFR